MLLGLDQTLRDRREPRQRELRRLLRELRGHALARGLRRLALRVHENERAGVVDGALHEEAEVTPLIDESADQAHAGGAVVRRERVEERRGLLPFGHAEQLVDVRELHAALGERRDHVENALRVPQRALRVPRDRLERRGLGFQALLLADLRELRDNALVRDAPEVEAL